MKTRGIINLLEIKRLQVIVISKNKSRGNLFEY